MKGSTIVNAAMVCLLTATAVLFASAQTAPQTPPAKPAPKPTPKKTMPRPAAELLPVIPVATRERSYSVTLTLPFEGQASLSANFRITTKDTAGNVLMTQDGGGVSLTEAELNAIPAFDSFRTQLAPVLRAKRNQYP